MHMKAPRRQDPDQMRSPIDGFPRPSRADRPPRPQRLAGKAACAAVIGALGLCLTTPLCAEERKVMRASDLIEMIGVNVHMGYTDGAYVRADNVLADLKFLGINHIRDVLRGIESQPALQARAALKGLVHNNIRLNIFCPTGWDATSVAWLRSLETAVPGAIASIEGYNEINNFPVTFEGQSGAAAAKAGQKALYETIKSDEVLKHVPVIDMTGFEMIRDPTFSYATTLTGYADVMNIHAYAQNGAQPHDWINPARPAIYKNVGADLPKVITEFGYASRPESNWGFIGVDERTQAKGVLNGLFAAARSGYDKVYLYELLDEKPDPALTDLQFHFGLFTFDNTPKLAAQTIRNVTTILASDDQPPKSPGTPANEPPISVRADEPDNDLPVYSMVLAKGNGTRIVAVWREPPFWDRATGRPLEAPSIQATVSFGRSCGTIKIYDVLRSGEPTSTGRGNSLALAVLDHVQLLECAP